MAFFKSRAPNSSTAESNKDDAQSMDSLRKQARHRLIGATVLVVIAVLGFPLVFDTKPRDLAADIRIEMPERDAVRPSQPPSIAIPDELVTAKVPLSEAVSANEQVVAEDSKKSSATADIPTASEPPVAASKSPENKPKSEPEKTATVPADTSNAAKPTAKEPVAERFIVQFGAFSDEAKVKDIRSKLEKSGVKTYIHIAQTSEGRRTRVRAGPFATREEAQKIINKTKSLQLNAVVLIL
jgi:DedD protein